MITYDAQQRIFHLKASHCSYLLGVSPGGDLQLIHWGTALSKSDMDSLLGSWRAQADSPFLETQNREFAGFGSNDLRSPALLLSHADGSRLSHFVYQGHTISEGKPDFPGPQSYVEAASEASTLCLNLKDSLSGQHLELFYTLFPGRDIICRRAAVTQGQAPGILLKMMSASLDFPAGKYWSTSLPGDWARERMVQQGPVQQALLRLENRRGQAHRMSPFVAISDTEPEENSGQVWGLSMVYSGNWLIELEGQPSGRMRVNAGLNDFDFRWQMDAGEKFVSPECVLAWSGEGMGGLSRKLHSFVKSGICRGPWRDQPRPVLLNSWEAHYFNFSHEGIVKLAQGAKELGADLLVLDDGWFGARDSDNGSLGDWFDDTRKLPQGVKGLADAVHGLGLKFGLWFEPEMISPQSKLYGGHPDWALAVDGRKPTTSRNQFVLDMSRKEIRDYLFERLGHYVESAKLDYIKWDMNRPLWEVGSKAWPAERQGELSHRFIMGTYELMGRLRDKFPQLLVEGCTGGGGRFDLGMLAYHPQFWASDNTDAYDRIFIQWGSSFFLPPICMGSHISAVPNHQTGRSAPMTLRAHVAMSGNLGLELDPAKLSADEKREVAAHIAKYREIRHLVQTGDFYRLADPYKDPRPAWAFVSADKREALLFAFQPRSPFRGLEPLPLKMHGLNPEFHYEVDGLKQTYSGAFLMRQGLIPQFGQGDSQSVIYRLKTV